jgi:tetratricopeptide (TPR) repeat protein
MAVLKAKSCFTMATTRSRHHLGWASSIPLFLIAGIIRSLSAGVSVPLEELQHLQGLIQNGDLSAARERLDQALKRFPDDFHLHNFLGVVQIQQGNEAAAESSFKKALKLAPRFAGAYLNLGRLYQQRAAREPAALRLGLETYEQLLRFEPDQTEARYQTAVLLQQLRRYQASQSHLSRLPADSQQRSQVLALRCVNLAGLGELQAAAESARRLLASPDLSEADVMTVLPALGKSSGSSLPQTLLEGLVERKLASSVALRQLGLLYEEQKQFERARKTLESAAQDRSQLSGLLVDLARVAHKQGDHRGALSYLAHARDLEPKNAGIHFFFGMVCVELELPLDARKSLQEAVALESDNAYYNYALASVLLRDRDPSLSIPYFQKFLELRPGDPRGRFSLGAAYFYSNDFAKAREELEAVAGQPETAAGAHYFLARLAKQENNLPQALEHLQQSLRANPKYAEAHAELGLIHIRHREYDKAERELSLALELDPDSYLANLNLLNLFQRTRDPREEGQASRFEEIKKKRSERQQALMRTLEIRPY